jgi:hypothetical protein
MKLAMELCTRTLRQILEPHWCTFRPLFLNWLKSDEDLRASELLCSGSKLQSDVAPPIVNLVRARHTDRYFDIGRYSPVAGQRRE